MVFIIGGSGYIGGNLCEYFSKKGKLSHGTYYNSPKKDLVFFDLENPNIEDLKKYSKNDEYIIICSAIPNIDFCKKNKERAYNLNVKGTKKTLEQIFELEKIPIFLSSDYVFNGKKGNYSEIDETNPCNVYGNHKRIIEKFLLESGRDFLITRISKIFGLKPNDNTLLTSWAKQLREGNEIYCAQDQRFSATHVGDLVRALDISMNKKLIGLYNVASPESFSRYELATMIKKELNIKSGKINTCNINDFDFADLRPLDTSLDVKKFNKATQFEFSKMIACINKIK